MTIPRSTPLLLCFAALAACYSPKSSKESADADVYRILDSASARTIGERSKLAVERPIDTLRKRLVKTPTPITLTLVEALDVAGENNREFQTQKEALFTAALNLTRNQNDFAWRFGGTSTDNINGVGDDSSNYRVGEGLNAQANSTAGTRLVANFVQTFLKSVIHGGNFDGGSILDLTLTQPLLRGAGRRIAREPLTQAERDVIYAMRAFERFRSQTAIGLVSDYWTVVRQMNDLASVEANYLSLRTSREQIEQLFNAGRKTINDLGRAKTSEFNADAQRVTARNRLQTALDQFKLTLGLPVAALIELDPAEMAKLTSIGVEELTLAEAAAIDLSLQRRYDFRTILDQVEDAGRKVIVAEDALNLQLDLTTAVSVPAEAGRGPNVDWSKVNWSVGFNLDLALNRVPARNAHRSTLITFDRAVRTREQSEDQLTANVRSAMRNIRAALNSYRIQLNAVDLAAQRVEATTELYAAGRVQALDKLDAQSALLAAQLSRNAAIVDYSIARLQLLNNLEAITLESHGLRFDMTLPMPLPKAAE